MANVVLGPVGAAPAAGRRVRGLCLPDGCLASLVVLQKVASELHPKVRNHGEGPY